MSILTARLIIISFILLGLFQHPAFAITCREMLENNGISSDLQSLPADLRINSNQPFDSFWEKSASNSRTARPPLLELPPDFYQNSFSDPHSLYSWVIEGMENKLQGDTTPGSYTYMDFQPSVDLMQGSHSIKDVLQNYRGLSNVIEELLGRFRFEIPREELIKLNNEVVERAARYLLLRGNQIKLRLILPSRSLRLIILPDTKTPLGRLAQDLKERGGGFSAQFEGYALMKFGFTAFIEKNLNALFISFGDIVEQDINSITLRHERRHIFNLANAERDWGDSTPVMGAFPENFLDGYSGFQSHDEPDAYMVTTIQIIDKLRDLLGANPLDVVMIQKYFQMLFKSIAHGLETSIRNIQLSGGVYSPHLSTLVANPTLLYGRNRLVSKFTVDTFENRKIKASVPFPGDFSFNEPENLGRLQNRVNSLTEISTAYAYQYEAARLAYDRIRVITKENTDLTSPYLLPVLESMRGILRQVSTASSVELRQRNLDDQVKRYHEILALRLYLAGLSNTVIPAPTPTSAPTPVH